MTSRGRWHLSFFSSFSSTNAKEACLVQVRVSEAVQLTRSEPTRSTGWVAVLLMHLAARSLASADPG